jgi:bifunctional NMN adenylyltransferase/nudix hydrolase
MVTHGVSYGVIVGRFQVDSLHPGHLELFRQVSEKHDRVIVFIGVSRTIPTKRNPLDFETRKKMIQADYPDFTILPLRDEQSDVYWSVKLDESISSVTQFTNNVTLYGGRDSFTPHYYGPHTVCQLEIPNLVSGTDIRAKITNRVMQTADFRAGVIYAANNRFPAVLPTVDVALFHDTGDGIKVLLGRKPGEDHFRFIGGFVNPGESLEDAARREAYEETKLDISSVEYIGSFPVKDWRYAKDKDTKITTSFFAGWTMTKTGKAGDDIGEIKWFDVAKFPTSGKPLSIEIEAVHLPLLDLLNKYITRRYQHVA